jgi:hypothetical protein
VIGGYGFAHGEPGEKKALAGVAPMSMGSRLGRSFRKVLAEINGLILRMPRGEYLLLAEIMGYNLRKRCGECSSMG